MVARPRCAGLRRENPGIEERRHMHHRDPLALGLIKVTPRPIKSSAVKLGSTSASMSVSSNACA
jgi:hypothetical protein